MALKLEYNNKMLPKGLEVDLGGFMVENGGSIELTREQEERLVALNAALPTDFFKDSEDVKVSGTGFLTKKDLEALHPTPVEVEEEKVPIVTEEGGDT